MIIELLFWFQKLNSVLQVMFCWVFSSLDFDYAEL